MQSTNVTLVRRLKETNRPYWPLYAEFAVLLIGTGVFIATYRS